MRHNMAQHNIAPKNTALHILALRYFLTALVLCCTFALWAEQRDQTGRDQARRDRIKRMSPEDQQKLADKKAHFYQNFSKKQRERLHEIHRRFRKFSQSEQNRLRNLHEHLSTDKRSVELRRAIQRYFDWLKNLPTEERNELSKIEPKERIEQIREKHRYVTWYKKLPEDGRKSLSQMNPAAQRAKFNQMRQKHGKGTKLYAAVDAYRLNDHDLEAVKQWFKEIFQQRERHMLELMPPQLRARYKGLSRPEQTKLLIHRMLLSRGRPSATFGQKDIQRLTEHLSHEAKKHLQNADTPEQKRRIIWTWIQTAFLDRSKIGPHDSPTGRSRFRHFKKIPESRAKPRH